MHLWKACLVLLAVSAVGCATALPNLFGNNVDFEAAKLKAAAAAAAAAATTTTTTELQQESAALTAEEVDSEIGKLQAHMDLAITRSDPYSTVFKFFDLFEKIMTASMDVVDALKAPFRWLADKIKAKRDKSDFKTDSLDEVIQWAKNNCDELLHQVGGQGDWQRMSLTHAFAAIGNGVIPGSIEGVAARSCVSADEQKKYIFKEYKFTKSASGFYNGDVEPDDDVPLMAWASRQGSIAFHKAQKEHPNSGRQLWLDVMMEESRRGLRMAFPWGAAYVQDHCAWFFNTAGNGLAHMCYLYASFTENIVFWGSPIGNRGFSGSYDAKVWDHMLVGIMKTFEAGEMNYFEQGAGQFHLLDHWSGNYYTINENCYMLDYVQGNVAQALKFALIVPTKYYTMDYRNTMRAVCQYATLVIKNASRQKVTGFSTLEKVWRTLFSSSKKGEELNPSDCKLEKGLPEFHAKFTVGELLDDAEIENFQFSSQSIRHINS